jgi:ribosomal subunit interface protein
MNVNIATDGVELTPRVKAIIDKKFLPKLNKFFKDSPNDSITVQLMLKTHERWGYSARCVLDIPGKNIHAEQVHKELTYAITALAKEIENRLRKKKEKEQEK